MPDADVAQLPAGLGTPDCFSEAEIGVSHHPEHCVDAPGEEGLDHRIRYRTGPFDQVGKRYPTLPVILYDGERLGCVAEVARWRAGDRVVVVAVPGTAQQAVLDGTFAQRATLMRTVIGQGAELSAAAGHGDAASVDDRGEHTAVVWQVGHRMPPGSRWCRWDAHTVTGVVKYGNSGRIFSGSGAIPVPSGELVSTDSTLSMTLSASARPLTPV